MKQEAFKTNTWHSRNPNTTLITIFDVYGDTINRGRGVYIMVHFCLSVQLLMWDNSLLLSNL